jgi:hypothetical protein
MITRTSEKIKESFQYKIKLYNNIDFILPIRDDGYINTSQVCDSVMNPSKTAYRWTKLESSQKLVEILRKEIGSHKKSEEQSVYKQLIEIRKGNINTVGRGTWMHPNLGIILAQWCSPFFSLQVATWVNELIMRGTVTVSSNMSDKDTTTNMSELQLMYNKISKESCEKDVVIQSHIDTNDKLQIELRKKDVIIQSHIDTNDKLQIDLKKAHSSYQSILHKTIDV